MEAGAGLVFALRLGCSSRLTGCSMFVQQPQPQLAASPCMLLPLQAAEAFVKKGMGKDGRGSACALCVTSTIHKGGIEVPYVTLRRLQGPTAPDSADDGEPDELDDGDGSNVRDNPASGWLDDNGIDSLMALIQVRTHECRVAGHVR